MNRIYQTLLVFLALFIIYQQYKSAELEKFNNELRQQIDSLSFVSVELSKKIQTFKPDTVKIVKWKVKKVVKVVERPDTIKVIDTVFVRNERIPVIESYKFYSDEYINANIFAYSKAPVDSFKLAYKLKMDNIYKAVRPRIVVRKQKRNWFKPFMYGVGTTAAAILIYETVR